MLELIARVGTDRNRQLAIVRGYWKLSAAQADYNWAVDEGARLDQVAAAKGLESAILSVAQAGGQARVHEAQVGAVAAQQELADLLAWPSTTPLPLAADPPLVGPYRTYFDTLFAGRVPPARTRVIDRSLPIRLQAIQDRTLAVQAASSAIRYAEDARGKGQVDLQALLNCHAELARQRRAFLSTVRDYNLDIGEYALAVADPTLPNERLVAMLIVVKPATASAQRANTCACGLRRSTAATRFARQIGRRGQAERPPGQRLRGRRGEVEVVGNRKHAAPADTSANSISVSPVLRPATAHSVAGFVVSFLKRPADSAASAARLRPGTHSNSS